MSSDVSHPSPSDAADPRPAKNYVFMDTTQSILGLWHMVGMIPEEQLQVSVDLEGNNLSRHGTISLVQMKIRGFGSRVFIFDVTTLQQDAFTTSIEVPITESVKRTMSINFPLIPQRPVIDPARSRVTVITDPKTYSRTISLKSILESTVALKFMWDCRQDSNALFFLFGVSLQNVIDVQLIQSISTDFDWRDDDRKSYLKSLDKSMELYADIDEEKLEEFSDLKAKVKMMFDKLEGSYAIFDKRPLSEDLLQYAANDADGIFAVHDELAAKWVDGQQMRMVVSESNRRLARSKTEAYEGGPHNALAPRWSYYRISDRRELLLCAEIGLYAVCGNDCERSWGQHHKCREDSCACYATCEERRVKGAERWYAMTPDEQDATIAQIQKVELESRRCHSDEESCVARLVEDKGQISLTNEVEEEKKREAWLASDKFQIEEAYIAEERCDRYDLEKLEELEHPCKVWLWTIPCLLLLLNLSGPVSTALTVALLCHKYWEYRRQRDRKYHEERHGARAGELCLLWSEEMGHRIGLWAFASLLLVLRLLRPLCITVGFALLCKRYWYLHWKGRGLRDALRYLELSEEDYSWLSEEDQEEWDWLTNPEAYDELEYDEEYYGEDYYDGNNYDGEQWGPQEYNDDEYGPEWPGPKSPDLTSEESEGGWTKDAVSTEATTPITGVAWGGTPPPYITELEAGKYDGTMI